uniref:Uncharacterized protein n=1 Tax=Meloidogyne hapla TaxID=6305 RepID=A0A1I8BPD9_MELHA
MQNKIIIFAFLLILAFIMHTEYSSADPIMEHAAHLNPDGSLVEASEHLMSRFKRWGRYGGCCDCCDGSCGCVTCCYYSSG